ncbi:MAG TPA: hypothetical protein VHZ78_01800 [Rhizomicrobium sp.]|jgi:hypothetical protein|nr:hypothetical protein [Rhizomicrobium sp.]
MSKLLAAAAVLAIALPCAAAPAGWQSYHDARGFRVSFPAGWKINPAYHDDDYPTGEAPPPRLAALAIMPVKDLQPGTTLSSVRVAILPLPPSRTVCAASQFIAAPPPDFSSGFDIDRPDYAHMTGGDPGGWYSYEDYVWRISTAPCFAVHYTISYYAADSDQAKSEKPFDRTRLLAVLDAIRASVVLNARRARQTER